MLIARITFVAGEVYAAVRVACLDAAIYGVKRNFCVLSYMLETQRLHHNDTLTSTHPHLHTPSPAHTLTCTHPHLHTSSPVISLWIIYAGQYSYIGKNIY